MNTNGDAERARLKAELDEAADQARAARETEEKKLKEKAGTGAGGSSGDAGILALYDDVIKALADN